MEEVLESLHPQPDDILFFYYSGHGYNLKNRPGRFRLWMLIKNDARARVTGLFEHPNPGF
ncbi:hypothetical protein EHT25_22665 [Larkinella rosea]|uniref:Uncharacterized protein n=1 Tax=Larkinella rosea TaxID=2025312 RepID=A0A3P1BJY4_9BACT|nr:hypothetical protein EHT25_22665 [Larkinella rosea]